MIFSYISGEVSVRLSSSRNVGNHIFKNDYLTVTVVVLALLTHTQFLSPIDYRIWLMKCEPREIKIRPAKSSCYTERKLLVDKHVILKGNYTKETYGIQ